MNDGLVVLIPSRGRPDSVARTAVAFAETGADELHVIYAVERSDPTLDDYVDAVAEWFPEPHGFVLTVEGGAMAPSVNEAARAILRVTDPAPFALAVLNDDHLPRSVGWADRFLTELQAMGTGIVYGDDGIHGEKLATAWAMTTDIVRAINRVIPALVQHQYADNALCNLGQAAGCLRYLSDVDIEHAHPSVGKAETDEGYTRVNSRAMQARDRATYERWLRGAKRDRQVAAVRELVANARPVVPVEVVTGADES